MHFMFRLTTPRNFFGVIYALDTRYSVLVKEKPLAIKWDRHLTTKGYADSIRLLQIQYPIHTISAFCTLILTHKNALVKGFSKIISIFSRTRPRFSATTGGHSRRAPNLKWFGARSRAEARTPLGPVSPPCELASQIRRRFRLY